MPELERFSEAMSLFPVSHPGGLLIPLYRIGYLAHNGHFDHDGTVQNITVEGERQWRGAYTTLLIANLLFVEVETNSFRLPFHRR